jgi:XTP/dITP diphosphohydrolase
MPSWHSPERKVNEAPVGILLSSHSSSAEMSKEEKNKISHRGQAMQLFKASLEQ